MQNIPMNEIREKILTIQNLPTYPLHILLSNEMLNNFQIFNMTMNKLCVIGFILYGGIWLRIMYIFCKRTIKKTTHRIILNVPRRCGVCLGLIYYNYISHHKCYRKEIREDLYNDLPHAIVAATFWPITEIATIIAYYIYKNKFT